VTTVSLGNFEIERPRDFRLKGEEFAVAQFALHVKPVTDTQVANTFEKE
jgi:hypothetical protein